MSTLDQPPSAKYHFNLAYPSHALHRPRFVRIIKRLLKRPNVKALSQTITVTQNGIEGAIEHRIWIRRIPLTDSFHVNVVQNSSTPYIALYEGYLTAENARFPLATIWHHNYEGTQYEPAVKACKALLEDLRYAWEVAQYEIRAFESKGGAQ